VVIIARLAACAKGAGLPSEQAPLIGLRAPLGLQPVLQSVLWLLTLGLSRPTYSVLAIRSLLSQPVKSLNDVATWYVMGKPLMNLFAYGA